MGLHLHEGEGAWIEQGGRPRGSFDRRGRADARAAKPPEPLRLGEDRLRNGEALCDLFLKLEPDAASSCQLARYVHRAPKVLQKAELNVVRALWLFRLKKAPPLAQWYLLQNPEEFLLGNKRVIWGFLYDLMQVYTRDAEEEQAAHPTPTPWHAEDNTAVLLSGDEHSTGYSTTQRQQLDTSLVSWMHDKGVLKSVIGNLPPPPTTLALEGPIRDGTLLCLLTSAVLGRKLEGIVWRPASFDQCVHNVRLALAALLAEPRMGTRCLSIGADVKIVRGHWTTVLHLLEDIHRLDDGVSPAREGSIAAGVPYLGQPLSLSGSLGLEEELWSHSQSAVPGGSIASPVRAGMGRGDLLPSRSRDNSQTEEATLLYTTMRDESFEAAVGSPKLSFHQSEPEPGLEASSQKTSRTYSPERSRRGHADLLPESQ
jgi:hypothetical protein